MAERPKKIVYTEPVDYFPKELRKKYKLGEYAETEEKKKPAKKAVKKTQKKK